MNQTKFSLQPKLIGNLVELVPLQENDFDQVYQCASDPLVWEQHPQKTRYQKDIFRKFFDLAIDSKGAFAIYDHKSRKIIGSTRFYEYDENKKQIIVGYTFIERKYWGGKYNQEVKKLMLEHAFRFVDNVLFEIGEDNTRSRTAIERIGAKLIGKQVLDDKNHVVYKIEKDDFFKNPLFFPNDQHSGQCQCGDIKFHTINTHKSIEVCHCQFCQKLSGGAFQIWVQFDPKDLKISHGQTKKYQSSINVTREFCPNCGSHLFFSYSNRINQIYITSTSFNDANIKIPDSHIWTHRKLKWLHLDDKIAQY